MSNSLNSYQKNRLRSSYVSVIISIALVLFLVGFLGFVLLKSGQVSNYFKEKISITLFLNDDVTNEQINKFKTALKEEPYVKKVFFVSKEQAAERYSKDIGEDFLKFLGKNPLKNGVDLYLKSDYVTPEEINTIEKRFQKNVFVSEVSYDKDLVILLTKTIKKMSFWLLVLSGFFGFVAMVLINSSIRLSVYSKRFNIKTMQMVGATRSFIRKPFIWQSIKLGLIGALVALIGLGAIIYYANQYFPPLQLLKDYTSLAYLAGGVILVAIIITWISTFLATQRFLRLESDELYY